MYTFPHRWDAVQPGWFVRAPDGTTWRFDGVHLNIDGAAQALLTDDAGTVADIPVERSGMVDVLFMPVTTEDLALAALRRNFPDIEKISEIVDGPGQVPCNCVGLDHRNDCPNWRLPF